MNKSNLVSFKTNHGKGNQLRFFDIGTFIFKFARLDTYVPNLLNRNAQLLFILFLSRGLCRRNLKGCTQISYVTLAVKCVRVLRHGLVVDGEVEIEMHP